MIENTQQVNLFPTDTPVIAPNKPICPSILTRATGFMGEYDFTLNPYGGCAFGCTYCYAAFSLATKNYKKTGRNGFG